MRALLIAAVLGLSFNAFANEPAAPAAPAAPAVEESHSATSSTEVKKDGEVTKKEVKKSKKHSKK